MLFVFRVLFVALYSDHVGGVQFKKLVLPCLRHRKDRYFLAQPSNSYHDDDVYRRVYVRAEVGKDRLHQDIWTRGGITGVAPRVG